MFLSNKDKIATENETETKKVANLEREAKFWQNYRHYMLIRIHDEVPLRLKPILDPSSTNAPLASKSDVYAQRTEDLTDPTNILHNS